MLLHHGDHIHPLHTGTRQDHQLHGGRRPRRRLLLRDHPDREGLQRADRDPQHHAQARDHPGAHQQHAQRGADHLLGGRDATAPLNATTAIGFRTSLSAAETFERDGRHFYFDRWSDGGDASAQRRDRARRTGSTCARYYREDKAEGRPPPRPATEARARPARRARRRRRTRTGARSFADNQWWQVDLGSRARSTRCAWTGPPPTPASTRSRRPLNGSTWPTPPRRPCRPCPTATPKGVVETTFTPARRALRADPGRDAGDRIGHRLLRRARAGPGGRRPARNRDHSGPNGTTEQSQAPAGRSAATPAPPSSASSTAAAGRPAPRPSGTGPGRRHPHLPGPGHRPTRDGTPPPRRAR